MVHPVLPPSEDFAAYLVSHHHSHRMNVARQAMLQRMRNFHPTEVYPAISEALGVMAALGEFYAGPVDERGFISRVAGDPTRGRPVFVEESNSVELPTGATLQPLQARMLRILSDGASITVEALLKRAGSKATDHKAIAATIRNLRSTLTNSGIEVVTDRDGTVSMDSASCLLVQTSRSRNSGDVMHHAKWSIASNGIWFVTQIFLMSTIWRGIEQGTYWEIAIAGAVYVAATTIGSAAMMAHMLKTETGKRKVGASK